MNALVGLLVVVILWMTFDRVRCRRRLHLVRDDVGNEALVVNASFPHWENMLFMIDTAYAGPPVLSTSYLALQRRCRHGSVQTRYRETLRLLRNDVEERERHASVRKLLASGMCRGFTSGCTMRLMGIGDTVETQADMLLCPSLKLSGRSDNHAIDADVFVSNPLQGHVHILTTDYLLHRAPCVICPRRGVLRTRLMQYEQMSMRRQFAFQEAHFVGGAFAAHMDVGGTTLRIVVDTGAAAALSLSRSAVRKLKRYAPSDPPRSAMQVGVNNEHVCSDVLLADVRIGDLTFADVEVFANSHEVEGADGYAGMGLLRAVDLWLQPDAIGFRASGLSPRASEATRAGKCT